MKSIAFEVTVRDCQKDLKKVFEDQFAGTMKMLNDEDAWDKLAAYSRKEHPELYDKRLVVEKSAEEIEKSESADREVIDYFFKDWDKRVGDDKMEEVLHHYEERAGNLGGLKGLQDLGITLAFHLKDPAVLAELRKRGTKITGKITATTLKKFQNTLYKGYMEEGLSPYKVRKDIKGMFAQTYKRRAWTIARTETGIASQVVQHTTYVKNEIVSKGWRSFIDGATRETHILLNGTEIPIKDRFWNGLLHPLDPNGPPEEVINCRCSEYPIMGERTYCKGSKGDAADCTIPWTGGQVKAPKGRDAAMQALYAKPMAEGGIGVMQMMKMPLAQLNRLRKMVKAGQLNKAYQLLGKYSGQQAATIAKVPKKAFGSLSRQYADCRKIYGLA